MKPCGSELMIQKMIGMIGSGSWATALVKILLEQADQTVNWWVRSDDVRKGLLSTGRNPKHLPDLQLDATRLHITGDLADVVKQSSHLFLAIPSAYIGDTLESSHYNTYHTPHIQG